MDFLKNKKPNYQLFQLVFVAFLLFIIFSTYWLAKYSFMGAVTVWFYHALCLSAVFMLFHITTKLFGKMAGYLAFINFYLGFEYLTINTNCFWPWINFGNGLAGNTSIVQWYEYTGVAGGSFWILLSNLLLFLIIEKYLIQKRLPKNMLIIFIALIVIPFAFSYWLGFVQILTKYQKDSIAIIQPNVNSYQHKLTELSQQNEQIAKDHILPQLQNLTEDNYDYLVLPETTFPTVFNLEDSIYNNSTATFLKKYLKPSGRLIYGAYATNEEKQKFNAVVFESKAGHYFHVKAKLVPGVEMIPLINNQFSNKSSLFEKKYYSPLSDEAYNTQRDFPTAICYESVFGNDLAAQASYKNKPILIITNDGWFDNTTLIKQHLNLAKLRAIENRSFVVRSANSGISAIISNTGKVVEYLPNDVAGIIEAVVPQKHLTKTFYQKYTDIIYRIGALISLILLLYIFVATFTNNFKFKKLGFT